MESILTSVKKALGIMEDYEYFDTDIIMHINSVFSILGQLGGNLPASFSIHNKEPVWSEYITDSRLELIKSYMYMKVRLLFDPPISSSAMSAMENLVNEFEWRINAYADELKKDGGEMNGNG